jgi:hypothetical protein
MGDDFMSPLVVFLIDLAAKMALTAFVVVVVSVTVERSGPFIGALIAALPTAAGAAYIILALEHPPGFIAASAVGSIASSAGVAIFALIYTVLAQQRGLIVSLGTALLVWFAIAVALRLVPWTPLGAMVFYIAVFAVTIPLSWRYRTSGLPAKFLRRAYDIPLRALTAAIVVATVTTASYALGSFLSGVFAVFPIVMASSVVILHPRVGGVAAASMFAHAQIALPGLGFGFIALHYLAEPIGSWWALVVTLAVSIAWSGMLWLIRPRRKV